MKFISSNNIDLFKEILFRPQKEFRRIYDESGISLPYYDYERRAALIVAALFPMMLVSTMILHKFVYNMPWSTVLPAIFSLSIAITALASFLLLTYPLYKRSQIRGKIEQGLLYTLSYMTILSTGGISIERIMERISEVEENPWIKRIIDKFIVDIKLFGYGISAAFDDISKRNPSNIFKKLLDSIGNCVKTSGDLKGILSFEVESLLQMKREGLKKMVGILTYFSELYVALIVVAPILFIVMITILSVLGGGSDINSAVPQLNLIVFLGIPILASGFILMLDIVIGGDE
jgi:flagellar protein FlaJ